ncbi:MAG: Maf family protein [Desulfovibrionaceae bacterium]
MNHAIYSTRIPIVLASGSPRRRDFLQALGIEFRIEPSLAEEPAPQNKETPERYAMRMARIKGEEVAARFPDAAVIAADTVVALGEVILGKPADQADALRMLQMLRGQTHQVVTGCCLFLPEGTTQSFAASTDVRMRQTSDAELLAYAATGEPMDKAGAYAIQGIGAFLVEHVHGSYTNVVGLPLARLVVILLERGVILSREHTR